MVDNKEVPSKMIVTKIVSEMINPNGSITRYVKNVEPTKPVSIGSVSKPNKKITAVRWEFPQNNPMKQMSDKLGFELFGIDPEKDDKNEDEEGR